MQMPMKPHTLGDARATMLRGCAAAVLSIALLGLVSAMPAAHAMPAPEDVPSARPDEAAPAAALAPAAPQQVGGIMLGATGRREVSPGQLAADGAEDALLQGTSQLFTIDPTDGSSTLVGDIGFDVVSGLAVLPGPRLVASAQDDEDGAGKAILIEIDVNTGMGTLIGTISDKDDPPGCGQMDDLSYDALGETLYGIGNDCTDSGDTFLYEIDPISGAGTRVGGSTTYFGYFGNGVAVDESQEEIFFTPEGIGALVTLDSGSGVGTDVPGTTESLLPWIVALDVQPGTNDLYGVLRNEYIGEEQGPDPEDAADAALQPPPAQLIQIDKTNGDVTMIGPNMLPNLMDAIVFLEQADLGVSIYPLKGDLRRVAGETEASAAQPPNTVWAGEELVYDVNIFNNGPDTAIAATATITLPQQVLPNGEPAVEYIADTLGDCFDIGTPPTTVLLCDLGDIERFEGLNFQIKTRVNPLAVADQLDGTIVIQAQAQVESQTPDPNLANNFDEDECFVQDSADLMVMKIADREVAKAGETFEYTIMIENWGPSAARGVQFIDDLFSGEDVTILPPFETNRGYFNFANNPLGQVTCGFTPNPQQFECRLFGALETMDGGGAFVVNPDGSLAERGRWSVTVRAIANEDTDLVNKVRVWTGDLPGIAEDGGTPDPNPDDNVAQTNTRVMSAANLSLSKVDDVDPVLAGEILNYTLEVTNNGPSTAMNVVVEDNLPAELEIISVSAEQGSCNAGTPGDPLDPTTCAFNSIPEDGFQVDGTREMYIEARVKPDAIGDPASNVTIIENDAWTYSDTLDMDNSDNYVTEPTTVEGEADLVVFKSDEPAAFIAGGLISTEILVYNDGPSTAKQVQVRDSFPGPYEFIDVEVLDGEGECVYDVGRDDLLCNLGDIDPVPDVGRRVIITSRIDADTVPGSTVFNFASANSGVTPDPDTANNDPFVPPGCLREDQVQFGEPRCGTRTEVFGRAELEIDKELLTLNPVAGGLVSFRVTVTNDGPSDARDVLVEDSFPVGLNYLGDTDSCTLQGGTLLSCRPAGVSPTWILPAGESVSFDILFELDASFVPGDYSNEACVTYVLGTVTSQPLCDEADFVVGREADLRVRKYGKPDDEVRAGEAVTYTVIVDNLGPSFTGPVMVTDVLISDNPFKLLGIRPQLTNEYVPSCRYEVLDPITRAVLASGTVTLDPATEIDPPVDVPEMLQITCTNPGPMQVFGPFPQDGADGPGRWIWSYSVQADQGMQSLNNVASVSGVDPDPDLSNNESATEHQVTKVADLVVDKMDMGMNVFDDNGNNCSDQMVELPGEVTAGKMLMWTIKVGNLGPSMAENVKILDRLPPYVRVKDVEVMPPGAASCTTGESGSAIDRLMCGLGGLDPASDTSQVEIKITANVDPSAPDGALLENDVTIFSDVFDDDNSNNFDYTLTEVNTWADLAIRKTADPDPVVAGEPLRIFLEVDNFGPSDAKQVLVTDELPLEYQYLNAGAIPGGSTGAVCDYDAATRLVSCGLGTLPAGGTHGALHRRARRAGRRAAGPDERGDPQRRRGGEHHERPLRRQQPQRHPHGHPEPRGAAHREERLPGEPGGAGRGQRQHAAEPGRGHAPHLPASTCTTTAPRTRTTSR